MRRRKTQRIIAGAIAVVMVLAMVIPMILEYLI